MNVLDGVEVERLAPNERLQVAEEIPRHLYVAGHRPGLDEHRPFPVLAVAFVVNLRRRPRHGNGGGPGIGPQPQVGAEHVTIAGALLQYAHQVLGEGVTGEFLTAIFGPV